MASCHPGDKNNTLQNNLKKKKKAAVINIQEHAFVFPYKTNWGQQKRVASQGKLDRWWRGQKNDEDRRLILVPEQKRNMLIKLAKQSKEWKETSSRNDSVYNKPEGSAGKAKRQGKQL